MKKRGMHSRMETNSTATQNLGMAFRERPTLFMITPPRSMPTAAAGRLIAPVGWRG